MLTQPTHKVVRLISGVIITPGPFYAVHKYQLEYFLIVRQTETPNKSQLVSTITPNAHPEVTSKDNVKFTKSRVFFVVYAGMFDYEFFVQSNSICLAVFSASSLECDLLTRCKLMSIPADIPAEVTISPSSIHLLFL